jgi:ribosomal protein S18 acetylase RimI-like enzyme
LGYVPKLEDQTQYSIRPLTPADQLFLWEMLYQSLYVPEGGTPFERAILEHPDIAKYVRDWGRSSDSGFVAIVDNARPIGAVWLRMLSGSERGFGYVDENTPELGMAIVSEYRGKGIGTSLLDRLIASVNGVFESVSLSVAVGNPALRLYERFGFEVVEQHGDSITMKRRT